MDCVSNLSVEANVFVPGVPAHSTRQLTAPLQTCIPSSNLSALAPTFVPKLTVHKLYFLPVALQRDDLADVGTCSIPPATVAIREEDPPDVGTCGVPATVDSVHHEPTSPTVLTQSLVPSFCDPVLDQDGLCHCPLLQSAHPPFLPILPGHMFPKCREPCLRLLYIDDALLATSVHVDWETVYLLPTLGPHCTF